MRSRGSKPHRAVVPGAHAPWALAFALALPVLLPSPAAAQSTSGATTATLPTLRETMNSSAGNPRDDDRRLPTSTAAGRSRAVAAPAPVPDLGEEDPGADGISGLIRTETPGGARAAAGRPRPNNQGTDTVNNQAHAPAAEVDAALRPTTPSRTGSVGRIAPVAPLAPRSEVGPQTPRSATEPNPRDPQADKRVEAEKEDDDYAPLGLRTGTFTWMPALETSAGRSSNIAGKPSALPGAVFTVAPELVGKSDWSRHELQIDLRGSYAATPVDHDYDKPNGQIQLRGRIDLSDEMRMDVRTGWSWERQSNSSSDNPAETGVGSDLQTRTASLGITRDAGLIALTLRGDVERSDYSGGTTTTGAPLGSEVQNNTRLIGALRATVGSPGSLRPFVELQASHRDYDQDLISGSRRDGVGAAVKVGAVADLGPTLRGEISTGWGTERADDRTLPVMSGWLLDGSLAWSPTRLTVVKVTAKTEFQPTTLAGSPGAVSRTVGLTLDQSLRRDLVATAGIAFTGKSYFGVTQDERDVILSTGLTYKVNRNLQTFVRGSWEKFGSNIAGADYSTAVVMLGVRVQQ
jgi:hypothetical protein